MGIYYKYEQNEGVSRWKIPILFLVNHPSKQPLKKRFLASWGGGEGFKKRKFYLSLSLMVK